MDRFTHWTYPASGVCRVPVLPLRNLAQSSDQYIIDWLSHRQGKSQWCEHKPQIMNVWLFCSCLSDEKTRIGPDRVGLLEQCLTVCRWAERGREVLRWSHISIVRALYLRPSWWGVYITLHVHWLYPIQADCASISIELQLSIS